MATGEVPIPPTVWPEATPKANEERFFSIVCGNTHIHWAIHRGSENDYVPFRVWRSHKFTPSDLERDPLESLSTSLMDEAHNYVFGVHNEATADSAVRTANLRGAPTLSVYVISTNGEQMNGLKHIFSKVPSRLFLMQPDDFFTKSEGRYDGMGIDRCAALFAAARIQGTPALVFDGGTAMTYTALDGNKKIMGGGITLGLGAKLQALSNATGALPRISPIECQQLINHKRKTSDPFPVFALDTKEAILSNVLGEVASNCQKVIRHWLEEVGPATASAEDSGDPNNLRRTVVVTGGDGEILEQLLKPDSSGVVAVDPHSRSNMEQQYQIFRINALIHSGIAAVLFKQVKIEEKSKVSHANDWEVTVIGQRVAKKFDSINDSNGNDLFRGTVISIESEQGSERYQDLFTIRYDDTDEEEYDLVELHDALNLYSKVGESARTKASQIFDRNDMANKQASSKAAGGVVGKVRRQFEGAIEKRRLEEEENNLAAEVAKNVASAESAKKTMADSAKKKQKAATDAVKKAAAVQQQKPKANAQNKSQKKNSPKRGAQKEGSSSAKRAKHLVDDYKNQRVVKYFDDVVYFGKVTGYEEPTSDSDSDDEGLYTIAYDDGDGEDYNREELNISMTLYQSHKQDDKMASQP